MRLSCFVRLSCSSRVCAAAATGFHAWMMSAQSSSCCWGLLQSCPAVSCAGAVMNCAGSGLLLWFPLLLVGLLPLCRIALRSRWAQSRKRWCCLCLCWAVAACWCAACLLDRCRRTTCLKCLSSALGFLDRLPDVGRMYTCRCVERDLFGYVANAQVQHAAVCAGKGEQSWCRSTAGEDTAAVCALLGEIVRVQHSIFKSSGNVMVGS